MKDEKRKKKIKVTETAIQRFNRLWDEWHVARMRSRTKNIQRGIREKLGVKYAMRFEYFCHRQISTFLSDTALDDPSIPFCIRREFVADLFCIVTSSHTSL